MGVLLPPPMTVMYIFHRLGVVILFRLLDFCPLLACFEGKDHRRRARVSERFITLSFVVGWANLFLGCNLQVRMPQGAPVLPKLYGRQALELSTCFCCENQQNSIPTWRVPRKFGTESRVRSKSCLPFGTVSIASHRIDRFSRVFLQRRKEEDVSCSLSFLRESQNYRTELELFRRAHLSRFFCFRGLRLVRFRSDKFGDRCCLDWDQGGPGRVVVAPLH